MVWLTDIRRSLTRFLGDERGAAGLEFLAASPLLFGVMVFTAEYGQALRYRISLDGAVQDIARYLARAPVQETTDEAGNPSIAFYLEFLTEADAMLDARLGRDVTMSVSVSTADSANFRTPFFIIEVGGAVTVPMPLLGVINIWNDDDLPTGLTMAAAQQARWMGDAPAGAVHCSFLERYQGTC